MNAFKKLVPIPLPAALAAAAIAASAASAQHHSEPAAGSYEPASAAAVEILPATSGEGVDLEDARETIRIMCGVFDHVLERELSRQYRTPGFFSEGCRGFWIPGVGVLFQFEVGFPLKDDSEDGDDPDKEGDKDLWERIEERMGEGRRVEIPRKRGRGAFDPEPVEKLRETVLDIVARYAHRLELANDGLPETGQLIVIAQGGAGGEGGLHWRMDFPPPPRLFEFQADEDITIEALPGGFEDGGPPEAGDESERMERIEAFRDFEAYPVPEANGGDERAVLEKLRSIEEKLREIEARRGEIAEEIRREEGDGDVAEYIEQREELERAGSRLKQEVEELRQARGREREAMRFGGPPGRGRGGPEGLGRGRMMRGTGAGNREIIMMDSAGRRGESSAMIFQIAFEDIPASGGSADEIRDTVRITVY